MLHIEISNRHMCVEAGPASQDAVIKSISASPGLQCCGDKWSPCSPPSWIDTLFQTVYFIRPPSPFLKYQLFYSVLKLQPKWDIKLFLKWAL
jgi:hypothetical protein